MPGNGPSLPSQASDTAKSVGKGAAKVGAVAGTAGGSHEVAQQSTAASTSGGGMIPVAVGIIAALFVAWLIVRWEDE